jgi:hypothetical protein
MKDGETRTEAKYDFEVTFMGRILVFLLALFLTTAANAGLRDRLEPIVVSGDVRVAVDTFIIGTEDKYVATFHRFWSGR